MGNWQVRHFDEGGGELPDTTRLFDSEKRARIAFHTRIAALLADGHTLLAINSSDGVRLADSDGVVLIVTIGEVADEEPPYAVAIARHPDPRDRDYPYVVLVNDEDDGGIRWAVEDLDAALARAVASAFAGALCCDIDEVSGDIPGAKDWFGAGFGRIAEDDAVGEQVGQIVRALDGGALALAHSGDAAGYEDGLASTLVAALRWIGQNGRDRCQDAVEPRRIVALAGMALTERD